jgi:Cu+-exporting ATPase
MADTAENITLNVEGMTCSNCALGVARSLKQKGLENVNVNFSTGEASFALPDKNLLPRIIEDINKLGYKVIEPEAAKEGEQGITSIEKKFFFSLVFTLPLFLHMFIPWAPLHDPWVQLVLSIPVMIIGFMHFGRSALGSLRSGVPNMDVLIFIGSTAAFIYSLIGTINYQGTHEVHNYLFYETAATIITLVLLGNVLEHRSVRQTTTAIRELDKLQVTTAKKVEKHEGHEHFHEVSVTQLAAGDILIVNTGDKIPVDGEIVSGEASINEAMITGESIPADKTTGDKVIGGTIVSSGNMRMRAEVVGRNTVLSKIIEMVKNAQQAKPDIQKLGDRVSAVFVPVVLGISVVTFLVSYFIFHIPGQQALMSSIAVLVISCPCAMGLATPTAVMVGIGRAARRGILIKGGNTLEEFAKIRHIVFDKTGILTTGEFRIKEVKGSDGANEQELVNVLYSLEQNSSHPIARSIVAGLKDKAAAKIFTDIEEEKGLGIKAKDEAGNTWQLGSWRTVSHLTMDDMHQVYITKNGKLAGWVDIEDEVRINAKQTIEALHAQGIETIMLSGDSKRKCEELAARLGIKRVFSEQLPSQKLEQVEKLVKAAPTAMVGDGINDAPALARATVGISMSNATQAAIHSAQIVLLNTNDLAKVNEALQVSKHTLLTIKQNLFWAFFYNVIAIPVAAMGFLSPMVGALAMAFSDVIVIGNSIRLRYKKLE